MKILATSDLHGYLPEVPECDMLLVGGDVCPMHSHDVSYQLQWLDTNFRLWLESVPAKYIVGIAGNHDFVFESDLRRINALKLPWTYLQDSKAHIEDVRIWGLPYVPNLRRWAFFREKDDLKLHYDAVPKATDIVLSHGPPHTIGDLSMLGHVHCGTMAAWDMIERIKPQAFVCGHIHEGFGEYHLDVGTTVYNVSYVDEDYNVRGEFVSIKVDGKDTSNRISPVHDPDTDTRLPAEPSA